MRISDWSSDVCSSDLPIGVAPDGFNINDRAGAVAPQAMRARVVEERADVGLAFDGDADRLILADEIGQVIDGDQILGMIARSWSQDGRLKGGGVVATDRKRTRLNSSH